MGAQGSSIHHISNYSPGWMDWRERMSSSCPSTTNCIGSDGPRGHVLVDNVGGYLVCICRFLSSQEYRLGAHRPSQKPAGMHPFPPRHRHSALRGIQLHLLPKCYPHFLYLWWAEYSIRFSLQADHRWVEASGNFTTFSSLSLSVGYFQCAVLYSYLPKHQSEVISLF